MKIVVIVVLVLLVIGLYYYTDLTKEVISFTGNFVVDKTKGLIASLS